MKFPPQGTVIDLIQYFAQEVKSLKNDPAQVLDVPSLVSDGYITIDELAKYINYIGDTSLWAKFFIIWSADFVAKILNSANMDPSRAASILKDTNISVDTIFNVIKDANLSADKLQSILYSWGFDSKLIDLLTYGASDQEISASTTVTGVNRYRNLTIDSGITLSVDGQPGVIIAKSISNSGTIAKTATGGAGGAAGATGAGAGGNGGGGLIIVCDTLTNSGTIQANGENGGDASPTSVTTSGNGGNGGSGLFHVVSGDSPGKGGDGGSAIFGWGRGHVNGAGGGIGGASGSPSAVYSSGGGSSLVTYSTSNDLFEKIRKAVIDWFIINVVGKTPSTTESIPNFYGSGGGGGGAAAGTTTTAGGGGGGGGGELVILAVTLDNTGIIEANGGNGGSSGTSVGDDGGGGGGGGVVYVFYVSSINNGTVQANGGAGGSGYHSGAAGSAGVAKAIKV